MEEAGIPENFVKESHYVSFWNGTLSLSLSEVTLPCLNYDYLKFYLYFQMLDKYWYIYLICDPKIIYA